MLISVAIVFVMVLCLPAWFALHWRWNMKRIKWVGGYLILHSLVAFPIDAISHLTGIGEPSAPLVFYPLVILNVFLGPILVTLTTAYKVVEFWNLGGASICIISSGMIAWSKAILGDGYKVSAALFALAPTAGTVLEWAWSIIVFCWKVLAKLISDGYVKLQLNLSIDYLSIKLPGLVGLVPILVIGVTLIYCTFIESPNK